TGNDLTEPLTFNCTPINCSSLLGPMDDFKAFLGPETALAVFVDFKRLLESNKGVLPFSAAHVGRQTREGLAGIREFTMCEIEHFSDPANKSFPKFDKVAGQLLKLYTEFSQMNAHNLVEMSTYAAVERGIVANETLAYYMARCQIFLTKVGVDPARIRFRQHLSSEMAHYAQECWDAEVQTSYGWVTCARNVQRAHYDLHQHHKATNVKLV
ncbi:hypothetical protein PENTCL1PPCAC_10654, partial [Pristionchus entomophagus]